MISFPLSPVHTRGTAKLSVTPKRWRKLFPLVCAAVFCDFRHAYHRRQIFKMLNNFGRNNISLQCAGVLTK